MPSWVLKMQNSPETRNKEETRNQSENCVSPLCDNTGWGGRSNFHCLEEPRGKTATLI